MKWSIKHLPKRTQEELNTLQELITRHVPRCSMVVLFGSYARGNYVLWDENVEFNINTSYQSDYDIMIVVSNASIKHVEDRLRTVVTPKYHKAFAHRRHASPEFIVEYIDELNKNLDCGQYFFTEVVRDGIKLFDTKEFKLAKPRELSFQEIKEIAVGEFERTYPYGNELLFLGHTTIERKEYVVGSFLLHQACEKYYNVISLVFINYRPKSHRLKELKAKTKEYSKELAELFPTSTEFEERCFDLLCRAYIESRYNKKFNITKEELTYLLEQTERLKDITHRICTQQIAHYDALSR